MERLSKDIFENGFPEGLDQIFIPIVRALFPLKKNWYVHTNFQGRNRQCCQEDFFKIRQFLRLFSPKSPRSKWKIAKKSPTKYINS